MRRAVFLDRDGVIIENRTDYVKDWSEVRFLPGAFTALRRLGASAYALVMITNQSGVGRGLFSLAQARDINRRLAKEVLARGGRLDGLYLCPHRPGDGCPCRKPAPGMLLDAARDLDLALDGSFVVGDALTDMEAAAAVKALGILVLTGRGREAIVARDPHGPRYAIAPHLSAAADYILARGEGAA